jgi:hypothetical protein
VDVVDATGDSAVVDGITAALAAAGLTVGTVTSADPTSTPVTGIEYGSADAAAAQWLAEATSATGLLRAGAVPNVTLVLGPADSGTLVSAIDGLPACG